MVLEALIRKKAVKLTLLDETVFQSIRSYICPKLRPIAVKLWSLITVYIRSPFTLADHITAIQRPFSFSTKTMYIRFGDRILSFRSVYFPYEHKFVYFESITSIKRPFSFRSTAVYFQSGPYTLHLTPDLYTLGTFTIFSRDNTKPFQIYNAHQKECCANGSISLKGQCS